MSETEKTVREELSKITGESTDKISKDDTPRAFIFNCWAITRATVVQALIPVKLPGPILIAIPSISLGVRLFSFNILEIVEIKYAE